MNTTLKKRLLSVVLLSGVIATGSFLFSRPRRAMPLPAPVQTGRTVTSFSSRWGTYITNQAKFSPDWRTLAQPYDSDILLLRASDAQMIRRLAGAFRENFQFSSPESRGTISTIGFSRDGELVAAAGTYWPKNAPYILEEGNNPEQINTYLWLALWQVRDGRLLWRMNETRPYSYEHIQRKAHMNVLNDGTVQVMWELKGTPLWTVRQGRIVAEQMSPGQGHFGVVSQDWSHFALSGGPVTAMVLRNDKLKKLPVALPYPTAADWSPDNSLLAINGERRGVYRISDGGLAWQFGKNDSSEKFSRFSPNGKWAISTEYHREDSVQPERYIYYLRRARDGKLVRELPVQADHFSQPIFSPTSEAFALFGNGDLRFYRLTDGALLREVAGMNDYAINSAFSPDNKTLATVGEDLRLWDVESGKRLAILPDNRESLASVDWSPDGKLIATGHDGDGNNDTLRAWRVQDRKMLYEVQAGTMSGLSSVRFSNDSALIAVASPPFPAQIFDAHSGKKLVVLGGGTASDKNILSLEGKNSQSAVAWLPDGQTLLTGGADGLSVWNRNGQLQRRHREIANIAYMCLSNDSDLVAVGTSDSRIALLRVQDGTIAWHWKLKNPCEQENRLYRHPVYVTFLQDGRVLSCLHGRTELWDQRTGAALPVPFPPSIPALRYVASSDGRFIAQNSLRGLTLWQSKRAG